MHLSCYLISERCLATCPQATHIFDGLESWPTHFAYLENGRMLRGGRAGAAKAPRGAPREPCPGWHKIEGAGRCAQRFRLPSRTCVLVHARCHFNAGGPVSDIPELQAGTKLLRVVEGWLREEKEQRRQRQKEQGAAAGGGAAAPAAHPLMPSKHMAFFR